MDPISASSDSENTKLIIKMTTSNQNQKDKMRNRIQRTGFVTLVSLFSLSISIDYIGLHTGSGLNAGVLAWAAVSLVMFVVSIIVNRTQLKGKMASRFKERIVMLIANSCSGNYVDITAIIIFIIYIALVPSCINDFTYNGTLAWRPLLYICAGALCVYLKPTITIDNANIAQEDRKVIFSGLSNVTYRSSGTNLNVFADPIIKYQGIQEVAVLLSDKTFTKEATYIECDENSEAAAIFRKYKNGLTAIPDYCRAAEHTQLLETLIREYLIYKDKDHRERYERLKFSFTDPVDFDDFDQCNDAVIQQIETFKGKMHGGKKIYEDRHFLFNISPDTKVVTSVMTLNCLNGDRGMIYTQQNQRSSGENVQEYNPNVFVLDQQFLELTMERMSAKNK